MSRAEEGSNLFAEQRSESSTGSAYPTQQDIQATPDNDRALLLVPGLINRNSTGSVQVLPTSVPENRPRASIQGNEETDSLIPQGAARGSSARYTRHPNPAEEKPNLEVMSIKSRDSSIKYGCYLFSVIFGLFLVSGTAVVIALSGTNLPPKTLNPVTYAVQIQILNFVNGFWKKLLLVSTPDTPEGDNDYTILLSKVLETVWDNRTTTSSLYGATFKNMYAMEGSSFGLDLSNTTVTNATTFKLVVSVNITGGSKRQCHTVYHSQSDLLQHPFMCTINMSAAYDLIVQWVAAKGTVTETLNFKLPNIAYYTTSSHENCTLAPGISNCEINIPFTWSGGYHVLAIDSNSKPTQVYSIKFDVKGRVNFASIFVFIGPVIIAFIAVFVWAYWKKRLCCINLPSNN